MSQFGKFQNFCRDSTLSICNILVAPGTANQPLGSAYTNIGTARHQTCVLTGIHLSNGRYLGNLGSIIVDGISVLAIIALLLRTQRKAAAVGRREMQLFLIGCLFIVISEIFAVGGFPLDDTVRRGFTAVNIAAIAATFWVLLMNAIVGYQLIDDGTAASVGLIFVGTAAIFVGTGYLALAAAYNWPGHLQSYSSDHRNYALYVLYQIWPLFCMFCYFILESILVLRMLGEIRPMIWLTSAALFFAIGQVFNYVISIHICLPTGGKINGCFFQTLFNLLSIIMIWEFWSSITEDDWPEPVTNDYRADGRNYQYD